MEAEKNRVSDLYGYQILDTPPEEELEELVQLAAAICDTPVSIISFIDEKRQWYKAKIGIEINQVPVNKSFCRHTLDHPEKLLIVEDPSGDERFCNNPHVTADNGIRFYAGAPLVSKNGNVLGTVCVIDYVSKKFTEKQRIALKLISKKVMDYLEFRRIIKVQKQEIFLNAGKLKKLTNLAPGAIFKFLADKDGKYEFIFISDGIKNLVHPYWAKKLKKDPKIILKLLHPEDIDCFIGSFENSYKNIGPLDVEYRISNWDQPLMWHWLKANPEKRKDGVVVWYGTIQDITQKKNHMETLERMLFDLSHVIRKPTANILGCINVLKSGEGADGLTEEMIDLIQNQTNELESFIQLLNTYYLGQKNVLKKKWN